MTEPEAAVKGQRRYLAVILAASVLARVLAALVLGNQVDSLPGTADQVSYHTLALRLLDGHGFSFGEAWWPATQPNAPTAHWSYLYTLFLALVYGLTGGLPLAARLLQAVVVGLSMPWLTYQLGKHLFGTRTGLVAAALCAGYAYFIYYAGALMTEAFYITAVLAVLYLAIRLADNWPGEGAAVGHALTWRALGLGLGLGAAILLRQVFMIFAPVLLGWLWWVGLRRQRGRQALAVIGFAGAVVALLILPFTLYNYARFGELVLLNTNAGYAFYFANHPVYGVQFEPILSGETATYLDLLPVELKGLNEAQLDRELLRRGLAFVWDDPTRYWQLSLSRLAPLFLFWPTQESSHISNAARVASFGVLWPFMLGGALLYGFQTIAREGDGRRSGLILLLFAATYIAMHVLSWTLVRYRLPVDAVLLVVAARFMVVGATRVGALAPLRAPSHQL